VRQRKPHGADLLPAGRQAVEDPARDNEVRARVVVRERETEAEVVDRGERARGGRGGGDRVNDGAMSLQGELSLHLTEASEHRERQD
jgi:hypothetical protein